MMQKKLLVLAVAAAISAPAFADTSNVSVYGKLDMAFASTSNGTSAAGVAGASTNQVSSQVTKIGFKGSEDMGDGLSAIWQIEQQIDIDSAGTAGSQSTHNTFAGRNSFLGLKSEGMGTVLLGRHDTPYKIATRGLDLFGDQLADNRSLMGGRDKAAVGGGHFDSRPGDVLAYISPSMNGFTAAVAYVAGAEAATTSSNVKGSAWSLAGMYKAGPLYAALAYQTEDIGTAGTGSLGAANGINQSDKYKATKLGVGYTLDALQLNAVWEKTAYSPNGGGVDTLGRTDWYLGAKYSFGNDDIKLAYGKAGNPSGAVNTGASQVSLGYDHNLSKRTTVYAQYTKISNESGANFNITNAGSTAGNQTLPGVGANPSAFALGIKHSF